MLLFEAVKARLGPQAVRLGQRVQSLSPAPQGGWLVDGVLFPLLLLCLGYVARALLDASAAHFFAPSPAATDAARQWVRALRAEGGTNIHLALLEALLAGEPVIALAGLGLGLSIVDRKSVV